MPLDELNAPFDEQQILSINGYQISGVMNPFTCAICRDKWGTSLVIDNETGTARRESDEEQANGSTNPRNTEHIDHILIATKDGMLCPNCGYLQLWVHKLMGDWSWHQFRFPWQGQPAQ